MQIHFPFFLDGRGRVGQASEETHVRQLIEQVLFTSPGERVNRPEFGCGLLRAVFDPGSAEQLQVWQFLAQEELERWLGDRIEVEAVQIEQRDNKLLVRVAYRDLSSRRAGSAGFEVVTP